MSTVQKEMFALDAAARRRVALREALDAVDAAARDVASREAAVVEADATAKKRRAELTQAKNALHKAQHALARAAAALAEGNGETPAVVPLTDEVVTLALPAEVAEAVGAESFAGDDDRDWLKRLEVLLSDPAVMASYPKTAAALSSLRGAWPEDPTELARLVEAADAAAVCVEGELLDGLCVYEYLRPGMLRLMRGSFLLPLARQLREELIALARAEQTPPAEPAAKSKRSRTKQPAGLVSVSLPETPPQCRSVAEVEVEPAAGGRLVMEPSGRYVLLATIPGFGNWDNADLRPLDYRPTLTQIERACSEAAGVGLDRPDPQPQDEAFLIQFNLRCWDEAKHPERWRLAPIPEVACGPFVAPLRKAGLDCLGELAAYLESGRKLTDVKGIRKDVGVLIDCLRDAWSHTEPGQRGEWPAWMPPLPEGYVRPEAFPPKREPSGKKKTAEKKQCCRKCGRQHHDRWIYGEGGPLCGECADEKPDVNEANDPPAPPPTQAGPIDARDGIACWLPPDWPGRPPAWMTDEGSLKRFAGCLTQLRTLPTWWGRADDLTARLEQELVRSALRGTPFDDRDRAKIGAISRHREQRREAAPCWDEWAEFDVSLEGGAVIRCVYLADFNSHDKNQFMFKGPAEILSDTGVWVTWAVRDNAAQEGEGVIEYATRVCRAEAQVYAEKRRKAGKKRAPKTAQEGKL